MDLVDDSKAAEYLGKVVLIGVSYVDHENQLLDQKQWVGTIEAFSQKEGIKIRLQNSDSTFTLPPDGRGIRKAPPGNYRLRSTGEEIDNPDYLATWTCMSPDPKSPEPNKAVQ